MAVDPVKAAIEGATVDLVTSVVATAKTGTVATQTVETNKAVGIRVVAPDSGGLTTSELEAIPIRAPDGHMFPLSRVASIVPISGNRGSAAKTSSRWWR
jgi:Cu/Ag efflux pump CusA